MATYALIPGGGGDPWEWHRLAPELASRGHDAIAVRLPAEDDTAGWSEYADTVVDAIGDRADVVNPAELANRLEAYRLAVHGDGPVAGR